MIHLFDYECSAHQILKHYRQRTHWSRCHGGDSMNTARFSTTQLMLLLLLLSPMTLESDRCA